MKTVSIELIKVNFVSLSNNSMFHELTTSLASRSHKFMHYADTCLIFSKSKQSIVCIKKSITTFVENILSEVNFDKIKVGYVQEIKFLGHSFYLHKDEHRLSVHSKNEPNLRT